MTASRHVWFYATVPSTIADEPITRKDTRPSQATDSVSIRRYRVTEAILHRSIKREKSFIG
jgi:hypothetical protein